MSRFRSLSAKALVWIFSIYVFATLTSMAGMRVFGFLICVAAFVVYTTDWTERAVSRIRLTLIDRALLIFFFAVFVSAAFAETTAAEKIRSLWSANFILVYFAVRIASQIVGIERLLKSLPAIIAIIGVVGAYAVFQSLTGMDLIRGPKHPMLLFDDGTAFRARGFYHHPVTFGHAFSIALCLTFATLLLQPIVRNRFWIATAVVSLIGSLGAICSYTRGAWMALFAAIVVMSLFRLKKAFPVLALCGIVVLGAYAMSPNDLMKRASSVVSTSYGSNSIRLEIWRANAQMIKDHPILGVGFMRNEAELGNYFQKLGIQQEFRGHAHNIYLQIAAGMGVIGFLAFIIMIFAMAKYTVAKYLELTRRPDSPIWARILMLACIGAQVELLVGGLTDVPFLDSAVNRVFIVLVAVTVTVGEALTKSSPKELVI